MLKKLLLLIFTSVFFSACTSVIFQPSAKIYQPPAEFNIVKEDFFFLSKDKTKLHGWFLPAKSAPKVSLLFLHGNGNNISDHIGLVYWLADYGYNVYLIDYRGYGSSDGVAELEGVLSDIDAAIDYVTHQVGTDEKILLMGQSLGASMGIYSLSQYRHKEKILAYFSISAFSDYRQITREVLDRHWISWAFQWPLSFFINNDYSPVEFIAKISPVPLFILHSKDDLLVSKHHADILFAAAKQPKSLHFLEGGHNNIFAYEANRKTLLMLLTRIERSKISEPSKPLKVD